METTGEEVASGVIYVLANPAMPDYIKVGHTTNLEERMHELERVGAVPMGFDCLFAARVETPAAWVRMVRDLHYAKREGRCFFDAGMTEEIIRVFRMAKGDEFTPGLEPMVDEPEVVEGPSVEEMGAETEVKRTRGSNFNFEMLGLRDGDELEFAGEQDAVCVITVAKPPKVRYEGEEMTVTEAAARVLGRENTKGIQGPLWWRYEGENLADRRKRLAEETVG